MTNNKQQTAVDLFAERTFNLIELMKREWVNQDEFLDGMLKARNEAKEMEKEQSIGLIKQTAMFMAASHLDEEIANMSYEDVYKTYYEQTYGGGEQ